MHNEVPYPVAGRSVAGLGPALQEPNLNVIPLDGRMASLPQPSRHSLLQTLNEHSSQFPSTPQRRLSGLNNLVTLTPNLIRRALQLTPNRRSSEGGVESIASNYRDSVVVASVVLGNTIDKWQPNDRQRQLLKMIWSDDFDYLYNLGTHIYVYIFEHAPQTKNLFPAFIIHGDAWKESKEFGAQALKFVQTVSHVVKNIHHINRLQPILYNVGRAHVRFAKRGFRPEYWDVFHSAIKSALAGHIATMSILTEQDRTEAVEVWHLLSHYIVHQMRKGYMDSLAENTKGSRHEIDRV